MTVLTSMEQSDMAPLGLDVTPAEQVIPPGHPCQDGGTGQGGLLRRRGERAKGPARRQLPSW